MRRIVRVGNTYDVDILTNKRLHHNSLTSNSRAQSLRQKMSAMTARETFHGKNTRRSVMIQPLSDLTIVAIQLANEEGGACAPPTACQMKVRRGHDIDKAVIDDGDRRLSTSASACLGWS